MSLHLFVGDEELLIEQGVARVIDEVLPLEHRSLNLDVLDAASTSPGDVVVRLDTLPFFGDTRVVVVRTLDAWSAEEQGVLEMHLERGLPPAVSLFTARSLDRRSRLHKAIERLGTVHPCNTLTAREAVAWIDAHAGRLGKRLSPAAARTLVELAGTGLRILTLELDKLVAYVGDRDAITDEDVEAMASRLSEASVFALTDALGERRRPQAMRALTQILQTQHPLPVLAMVTGHFRLMLKAKVARARTDADLARVIGTHPYRAGKVRAQAQRFALGDFPRIFGLLEAADRAMKSTGQPELALERLVVELCGG